MGVITGFRLDKFAPRYRDCVEQNQIAIRGGRFPNLPHQNLGSVKMSDSFLTIVEDLLLNTLDMTSLHWKQFRRKGSRVPRLIFVEVYMLYLLNNAHGYEHSEEYDDRNAFYDLELSGYQANFAFEEGIECIVATLDSHGNVDFVHFVFLYQSTHTVNSDGKEYRILFGRKLDCKRLTKIESARTEPYKSLFDINGNFKRRSVIQISG